MTYFVTLLIAAFEAAKQFKSIYMIKSWLLNTINRENAKIKEMST